jgi:hypothetical protein
MLPMLGVKLIKDYDAVDTAVELTDDCEAVTQRFLTDKGVIEFSSSRLAAGQFLRSVPHQGFSQAPTAANDWAQLNRSRAKKLPE